jgi:hypothetical protein
MTLATNDVRATHDDLTDRELSIEALDAIAAGRGFPLPEPHLPPHLHWPPAPSPIWSGGSVGLVVSFKLF